MCAGEGKLIISKVGNMLEPSGLGLIAHFHQRVRVGSVLKVRYGSVQS